MILIKRLDDGLPLPSYAHAGDAGADLHSALDVTIGPGERVLVQTGVAIALPAGFAGFVHPRSGLALRSGVTVANAPGTVDAGYRGELKVILVNLDPVQPAVIKRGDRIAQLIIQRIEHPRFIVVEQLPGSDRGERGFGSSDVAPA